MAFGTIDFTGVEVTPLAQVAGTGFSIDSLTSSGHLSRPTPDEPELGAPVAKLNFEPK